MFMLPQCVKAKARRIQLFQLNYIWWGASIKDVHTPGGGVFIRKRKWAFLNFHCVILWQADNEQTSPWISPCMSTRGRGTHTPLPSSHHMTLVYPWLWNRHFNTSTHGCGTDKGALRLESKPATNNSSQDLNPLRI